MGPIEFIAVGFEGNRFTGEILPELQSLRERGIIRVLDFLFVKKDAAGETRSIDLTELNAERLALIGDQPAETAWFSQDDIDRMAGDIPENSSVAMVLFEHTWATRLGQVTRDAGGEVLAFDRIPSADAQSVLAELGIESEPPRDAARV